MKKFLRYVSFVGLVAGGFAFNLHLNKPTTSSFNGSNQTYNFSSVDFFKKKNVTAFSSDTNNTFHNFFVGTRSGLFWSTDNGKTFGLVPLPDGNVTGWVTKIRPYYTSSDKGYSVGFFVLLNEPNSTPTNPQKVIYKISLTGSNKISEFDQVQIENKYITDFLVTAKQHLFVGTNNGLYESVSLNSVALEAVTADIPFTQITTLYQDASGFVWVGEPKYAYSSNVGYPTLSDNFRKVFSFDQGWVEGDKVSLITQNRSNHYWLGLYTRNNTSANSNTPFLYRSTSPSPPNISFVPVSVTGGQVTYPTGIKGSAQTVDNSLWFSTLSNGVLLFANNKLTKTTGIGNQTVTAILDATPPSSSEKILWATTDTGKVFASVNPSATQSTFNLATTFSDSGKKGFFINTTFQDTVSQKIYFGTSDGLYFLGNNSVIPETGGLSALGLGLIISGSVLVLLAASSGVYFWRRKKVACPLQKPKK